MRTKKQKLRKSIRSFCIIVSVIIIAFCSTVIFQKTVNKDGQTKEEVFLSYTNKLNTSYEVNLKENEFIEEKTLPMGQNYVTELIDEIDMDFDFLYDASKYADLKYSYSVVGVLNGTYSKNGISEKIWEKEYILLEETENKTSKDKISINEEIKIDIQKYNKEVTNFERKLGIAIDAKLNVQLRVKMEGEIEKVKLKNNYISNIDITLGEKTTQITGDLTDEKISTEKKTVESYSKLDTVVIIINFGFILIALYLLKYITVNTTNINTIRNSYKLELNRILKACEDKIVKLSTNIDLNGKETVKVKDFGELIKLSEELYKPILYWDTDKNEEAQFFVITDNVIYIFILK